MKGFEGKNLILAVSRGCWGTLGGAMLDKNTNCWHQHLALFSTSFTLYHFMAKVTYPYHWLVLSSYVYLFLTESLMEN